MNEEWTAWVGISPSEIWNQNMSQFRSQRIRDFLAKIPKKISSLESKVAGSFLEDSIFMKIKKEKPD